jgi:twitching motility protein PilT
MDITELLAFAVKNKASDLHLSAGLPPLIRVHGDIRRINLPPMEHEDVHAMVYDIMSDHQRKIYEETLECDFSFAVPNIARFRVNAFNQQRGAAAAFRTIPSKVLSLEELAAPKVFADLTDRPRGLILCTGPTGSGKSTTLAAMVNHVNENQYGHILTIEDPIEFLHRHKKATIHQRELHSDTTTFALALRAALRQAPKVILVGEMRDRETIEIALEASETGHLVLSTLHTIDASKTIERIVGVFPLSDQQAIRTRLAKAFRYIVSQRLLPKKDGSGRVAAIEILKSTMRTREYVEKGESEGKSLLDAMRDGDTDGMQHFDAEIEKLIRAGVVDFETGMGYATNAGNLRLEMADYLDSQGNRKAKPVSSPITELEIER